MAFASYTYTHPVLGEIEADIRYTIDDSDGVPTVLLGAVRVGEEWQPSCFMEGGRTLLLRPLYFGDEELETAVAARVRFKAEADDGWKANILRDEGYVYRGEGGNDPDGRMVRIRQREEV